MNPGLLRAALALLASAPCLVAQAQTAEKFGFSTFTPTGHTQVLQGTSRQEVQAEAILALPAASGSKRFPVIVVLPGAGGHVDDHLGFWRSRLLAAGFGVVAIDPMRIRHLAPEQSERLTPAADLVDAFSALKVLVQLPAVDADRVAVLGFSRGGLSAWDAQAEAFARAIMGADASARFAAHAALYPPCHYVHVEQKIAQKKAPVPTLLVLAGADARTPPEHCQALAKVALTRGYQPKIAVIEGAQHAFDYFTPVFTDRDGFSSKGCRPLGVDTAAPYPKPFHLDDGSPLVAGDGATPVSRIIEWSRQCRRPTAALTGNQKPAERDTAASMVVDFLTTALKP